MSRYGAPLVDTFAGFRILRRLSVGGMGELLLAMREGPGSFHREVVIKRLRPEMADSAQAVTMFLDEARLIGRLSHPNIVAVHELGQEGSEYFLVMEYIEGCNLRSLFDSAAPIAWPLVAHIGAASADALHYVHTLADEQGRPLGVVHRDISPHNIMVSSQGIVKVLDFGIAKSAERLTQTMSGEVKGKLAYMSPEQFRGRDVDGRTDVYALAVTLFELATGTSLLETPSVFDLSVLFVNQRIPRARQRLASLPELFDDCLARAMAIDPEQRYATAGALAADLQALLLAEGQNVGPAELRAALGPQLKRPLPKAQDLADMPATVPSNRRKVSPELADKTMQLPGQEAQAAEATAQSPGFSFDALPVAQSLSATTPVPKARVSARRKGPRWRALLAMAVLVSLGSIVAASWEGFFGAPRVQPQVHVQPQPQSQAQLQPQPQPRPPDRTPTELPLPLAGEAAVQSAAGEGGRARQPQPSTKRPTKVRQKGRPSLRTSSQSALPALPPAVSPPALPPAPQPPQTGRLSLASNLPLDVYVAGERIGATPLSVELPAGPVTLSLINRGEHVRISRAVVIESGGATATTVELRKGRLTINSKPWADVLLDGTKLGTTPVSDLPLWEGSYVLTLRNPDTGQTREVRTVIAPGDTTRISTTLDVAK